MREVAADGSAAAFSVFRRLEMAAVGAAGVRKEKSYVEND
jgi:hypothetical protein